MAWFDSVPLTKVTDRLFLGHYADAAGLVEHNPYDIQAVLNVSCEPPYTEHRDIQYVQVSFKDGHEVPEKAFLQCMQFLRFQHELQHRVLIHCAAGISRSPTITAAFLHHARIMDFNKALLFLFTKRPIVSPHPLVSNSVKKHLRLWPYDGTYANVPPSQAQVELTALSKRYIWEQHPDSRCQVRKALLDSTAESGERHLLICTCSKEIKDVVEQKGHEPNPSGTR